MIRPLLMIAAGGFVLCVASLSAAIAVGGQDFMARTAWGAAPWGGDWDWDDEGHGRRDGGGSGGPTETRELAWSGRDTVEVDVRADVTYTQAPGPAKLTVTGPRDLIERLAVDDERIYFRGRPSYARVQITMTAPNVTGFQLNGNDRLTIENYDQDRLDLDLEGSSDVTAKGRTRELDLEIAGSGQARLGELVLEDADVDIAGSGEATIAPKGRARIDVAGSGEVTLLTNPRSLQTDVAGSGTIRQETAPAPAAKDSPAAKSL